MNVYQKKLIPLLETEHLIHKEDSLPLLSSIRELSKKKILSPIEETFEELGGLDGSTLPIDPSVVDIELDGIGLVIDDEKCFNRYRKKTLLSELYDEDGFSFRQEYLRSCRAYEKQCLHAASGGQDWTHKKGAAAFGPSEENGDLGLNGSAGWKYKAFADFLTDYSAKVFQYKIVRISVHEHLMISGKQISIATLLKSNQHDYDKFLLNYILRKIRT